MDASMPLTRVLAFDLGTTHAGQTIRRFVTASAQEDDGLGVYGATGGLEVEFVIMAKKATTPAPKGPARRTL